VFVPSDKTDEYEQAASRTRPGRIFRQSTTLLFVTEFQALLAVALCIAKGGELTAALPVCCFTLSTVMWVCYTLTRAMSRVAFEIETIAFFLCTIGMAVTASSSQQDLFRQTIMIFVGVGMFFAVGWFLRDLDRAKKLRWPIAGAGLLLLAINLVFAQTVYGARNWLVIGGVSFQPSEFVKIAFVFAGAATLERLFARRNLVGFIGFAGACVGALALINDFGAALVFFVAYLVVAFLRSGDFATILLSVGGAGFAGFLALRFRSHIARRFATWGRAWEFASGAGYQQTRAMAAAASGGLVGVGAGAGWLKGVFAADTDLVFGIVCEELGLVVAFAAFCAVLAPAVFSVWSAGSSRSSFYVIAACAASSILVFQMMLNVLGAFDILPFTGVTFPFVSKGGSSLVSCWGLLAFVKAADTRQNASFVVKMPRKQIRN
jgi:cell division protein FtsW (lipid II flippase)